MGKKKSHNIIISFSQILQQTRHEKFMAQTLSINDGVEAERGDCSSEAVGL